MPYPLEVGGVDDYRIKVGSMLLTLVDPNRGYEVAYNRWYERDHFYAGCMIGPFLFAGSRWVATRALKDARWPNDDETIASPPDAGSYVAIYWVEKGHHADHFDVWARHQVRELYAEGRGFAERKHTHTVLYDHIGSRLPRHRSTRCRSSSRSTTATTGSSSCGSTRAADSDARALHEELRRLLAPRSGRRVADRDRELVDAVGGRERPARRPDGPREQGRWAGATVPAVVRRRRRAGRAARRPALHRRDREAADFATDASRRAVLPHRRRHRHVRRPALVDAADSGR